MWATKSAMEGRVGRGVRKCGPSGRKTGKHRVLEDDGASRLLDVALRARTIGAVHCDYALQRYEWCIAVA